MTLDEVIDLGRQRAGDVDAMAHRYPRDRWVDVIIQELRMLSVRQVPGASTTVDTSVQGSEAFVSDPADEFGAILALAAAVAMLEATYHGRLDRGEIGTIWRSGLEEESTVSHQKAYLQMVDAVRNELDQLKLIARRATFATRPQ